MAQLLGAGAVAVEIEGIAPERCSAGIELGIERPALLSTWPRCSHITVAVPLALLGMLGGPVPGDAVEGIERPAVGSPLGGLDDHRGSAGIERPELGRALDDGAVLARGSTMAGASNWFPVLGSRGRVLDDGAAIECSPRSWRSRCSAGITAARASTDADATGRPPANSRPAGVYLLATLPDNERDDPGYDSCQEPSYVWMHVGPPFQVRR